MSAKSGAQTDDLVVQRKVDAGSRFVIVCEHASYFIPDDLDHLGLPEKHRMSHAAWDPGAFGVADALSERLNARLVATRVSRLVYDCNRPPGAADAMPHESEIVVISGNAALDATEKARRTATYYAPFRSAVAAALEHPADPIVVTIHSFTPIYHGQSREVEIGVVHDADAALADVMLAFATQHTRHDVRRNQPYGPEDGVTHTLKEHALPAGRLNVMIEIRNDLIATEPEQWRMAKMLAGWLTQSAEHLSMKGRAACEA